MINKKGFTLVEILVAMFLTGIVMAGLVGLWMSSSNFASSAQREILFKNMFSAAERQIFQDISQASYVMDRVGINRDCESEARTMLVLFRNFTRDKKDPGWCINEGKGEFSMVVYCADKANNKIYRVEASAPCEGTIPAYCICDNSSAVLASGVITDGPENLDATVSGNLVHMRFSSKTKLGKSQRPLQLNFDRTFAFQGVGVQ